MVCGAGVLGRWPGAKASAAGGHSPGRRSPGLWLERPQALTHGLGKIDFDDAAGAKGTHAYFGVMNEVQVGNLTVAAFAFF